jgi:hypothetical protein
MGKSGWKRLLDGAPWFRGEGQYPLAAYSEYMPPPRLLQKPYGNPPRLLEEKDPWCWPIMEYEEAFWLRPGLDKLAHQILGALVHLAHGRPAHGLSKGKLADNPYWPPELAGHVHRLRHEHYLTLMPLALARTQDDKGRVLWTLFGCSEQGPARAFWKSFYKSPRKEIPAEESVGFVRTLLHTVYAEPMEKLTDLRQAGFRVLPQEHDPPIDLWREEGLPAWTEPYLWSKGQSAHAVKYLLTFRPFGKLPSAVQKAYLAGELHLLPFPGSLLFWGTAPYLKLHAELPLALQIPLLHAVARHEGPLGIRVPQSGWLHEPRPGQTEPTEFHGPMRNTYKRTHRWARVHRDEDELALEGREDRLVRVLFSTAGDDMGLYGKPMARNAQLWTEDCRLLLDGPDATREAIHQAFHQIHNGGLFGYRFQFPAMRVGLHEVYWHRPLVAYVSPTTEQVIVLRDAPTGYLTAYRADAPALERPVEMWPQFLQRELHLAAIELFEHAHDIRPHITTRNIRKLLDTYHLIGKPLPHSFARALLTLAKKETLDGWLESLPQHCGDPERAYRLVGDLRRHITPPPARPGKPVSLTYKQTARRSFEVAYWKTIALLAEGRYRTKNNADVVRDPPTQKALAHHHRRDLEHLGDYLLDYYAKQVKAARMTGRALVGDLPFSWRTDFDFKLYDGWLRNQERLTHERDLMVVIPGRDRKRALIMSDHYDTAYMEDHYGSQSDGKGPRLAAAGADDNYSATAALMLAAPIFLKLSRAGKLACDIWLVHLTGEEFPADCMGARYLTQCLVEGTLKMRLPDGRQHNLSKTRVQGVYVADMIAHNNDHDRDIFQMAPGMSRESMWLAYQAHLANEAWNASATLWNRKPARLGCGRCQRSADSSKIPAIAPHPHLHGEIRPRYDPRSTLYNTDGQIFSDAGVPVVLFMENYDINRTGYHDSHDTMENIDLDYGSALAAIFIESVVRAATEKPEF